MALESDPGEVLLLRGSLCSAFAWEQSVGWESIARSFIGCAAPTRRWSSSPGMNKMIFYNASPELPAYAARSWPVRRCCPKQLHRSFVQSTIALFTTHENFKEFE